MLLIIRPHPDVLEDAGIHGGGLQKGLYEALESLALVALGEGYGAVFCKYVCEAHGVDLHYAGVRIGYCLADDKHRSVLLGKLDCP